MKKQVCILLLIFITSCKYFQGDECNNTLPIVGTYQNTYDIKAKNLLIIRKDGTFEQIFVKNDIIKKNKETF